MIRAVESIPNTDTKPSTTMMLQKDIGEAWEQGISRFEFEGDYKWKYAAGYARQAADKWFRKKVGKDFRETAKRLYPDEWRRIRPDIWFTRQFYKIHERKKPDRIHVYCEFLHRADYSEFLEQAVRMAKEERKR